MGQTTIKVSILVLLDKSNHSFIEIFLVVKGLIMRHIAWNYKQWEHIKAEKIKIFIRKMYEQMYAQIQRKNTMINSLPYFYGRKEINSKIKFLITEMFVF